MVYILGKAHVIIKPFDISTEVPPGKTVLDVLREIGIPIRSDCGGIGICGKCIVRIAGPVSAPSTNEIKLLGQEKIKAGFRLACQTKILSGKIEVYIPRESRIWKYRSVDIGFERHVSLAPAVRKIHIIVPRATLEDPRPDLDRILCHDNECLEAEIISLEVLRKIPDILRSCKWSVTLVLHDGKILDVECNDTRSKTYGIAVDLGTSRIVVHLVDLTNGKTLAIESAPNPQQIFGADIISRLTYVIQRPNATQQLQKLVVQVINELIKKASSGTGINIKNIYEVVVAGNPVMNHLFLGIQPRYLGYSPYVPAFGIPLVVRAQDVGLTINDNGMVYIMPNIAGFIGGDAIADAIAVGLDECSEPCVLIDIGTNTEILLNNGRDIYAASAPAGPAFEGAVTRYGMKATNGAIHKVFIYFSESEGDYEVRYEVIGNVKPLGLCGSAYIDAIAHLYRLGLINKWGKFNKGTVTKRFVTRNGEKGFIIAWNRESAKGEDIAVYAKDIEAILLAKAAIAATFKILSWKANLKVEEISKIYVAGSFGISLDPENAIAIGLLPGINPQRVIFVGNAAISGAKLILKSIKVRKKAKELARKVKYVEVAAEPSFRRIFHEMLCLP